jgi:hypothetical protein
MECIVEHNQKAKVKHGYRGVVARGDKWIAQITIVDKKVHLGTYDTPQAAARAYDEAAKKHHGKAAILNFL